MSMCVKKLTGILFVLVMALGMLTLPGVRAGAESNITTISSAADWDAFAQSVNTGTTYSGKEVILTEDITVDEETTIVIETFEDAEDTAVEEEAMDDLVVEISEDSGEYDALEESIVEEDILPAEELAETAEEDYMEVL